ncbi:MAG: protease PrsW [Actinobacteria bacterium]|nr:MAG: protease PrsW [Actinomycetota bacterium]
MPRRGWGRQTSLFQWREPAFWLYAAIVVVTALYTVGQQQLFQKLSPSGWALSWGLLLVYGLPLFLAIYLLDLYEREPMSLVLGALVWGAVAATVLSGIANEGWGLVVARVGGPVFAAEWTAALTAPFVEETLKLSGVVLIYLIARDEMDDVMDGFVYGAMVGLGFALVEDVFYFIAIFGGTPGGVLAGFYVRVVSSGLYGHVLYTGLSGMGVAYFVSRRGEVPVRPPARGRDRAVRGGGRGALPVELAPARLLPGERRRRRRLAPHPARGRRQGRPAVAGRRRARSARPPARTDVARGGPALGGGLTRALGGGAPGAARPERPPPIAARDACSCRRCRRAAAETSAEGAGEPRHGPYARRVGRRSGARPSARPVHVAPRRPARDALCGARGNPARGVSMRLGRLRP